MSIRNTQDARLLNNGAVLDGTIRRESITAGTISSNVLTIDYWSNNIVSVSSPAANFTVNLTNAPLDNDKTINFNVIVTQGATGRIPNAFQIGGAAQTLRWVGNITPTATNSKIDIFSFTVIRQSSAWTVLGQASLNF
jgi:hypothetical protein